MYNTLHAYYGRWNNTVDKKMAFGLRVWVEILRPPFLVCVLLDKFLLFPHLYIGIIVATL